MSHLKVLMADDEPSVLEIMSRKVASSHFQVISAKNGREAWDKIQKENPDIVLLDLMMPEMNGFAVLNELRKNPPSDKWIPVIIISSSDEIEHMQKSFHLQAEHYLVKPCTIEDILKAIKSMAALIPLRNTP